MWRVILRSSNLEGMRSSKNKIRYEQGSWRTGARTLRTGLPALLRNKKLRTGLQAIATSNRPSPAFRFRFPGHSAGFPAAVPAGPFYLPASGGRASVFGRNKKNKASWTLSDNKHADRSSNCQGKHLLDPSWKDKKSVLSLKTQSEKRVCPPISGLATAKPRSTSLRGPWPHEDSQEVCGQQHRLPTAPHQVWGMNQRSEPVRCICMAA